ncbi:transcriptional regulator, LacI family [Thermobaculum terrenum ATCC BAA-798]|uniref:Transcriptional regulator, LacI family n=1 Tax=Thermobaculum terrenum (strain ATCC BAA-798 / CCMEE 7001 / YNP1) TaxID=525904 RepID=D1CH89_THET1|nr:LacI family DNA-binding transcriptional regulator [Thermobaculum terrenum]ACZ43110.1 transcriptional regulator, LacI family [Thermobaculum terrenum ATCC BAA-798]
MGRQKPSMRDIARAANVSVSAVSLVARNKPGVSEETRNRVLSIMAEMGYSPSVKGNGHTGTVGLLIEKGSMPVIVDIFYGDIIRGLQSEAQRLGYQVALHMFDRAQENLDSLRDSLLGSVQGLIVANDGDISHDMVVQLQSFELPMVLIESYVPGKELHCVIGDNFAAGYTAMQHLIDLGHRDIAVLRGPTKYSSLVDRFHGAMSALAEARLSVPAEMMPAPVSGHPQKGYLQMREILQAGLKPTAVFAVSDKTAFGAMNAIREAGLRIPQDISVVGIDDVSESAYTHPPLTTVHIPRQEMGILAMRKLHRLMEGEREIPTKTLVYSRLVERQSTSRFSDKS